MTDIEYIIAILMSTCLGFLVGYVFRFEQEKKELSRVGIISGEDAERFERNMIENEIKAGVRNPD